MHYGLLLAAFVTGAFVTGERRDYTDGNHLLAVRSQLFHAQLDVEEEAGTIEELSNFTREECIQRSDVSEVLSALRRDASSQLRQEVKVVPVDAFAPARLFRDYVSHNAPVLIKGAASDMLGRSQEMWTPTGLVRNTGKRRRKVAVNTTSLNKNLHRTVNSILKHNDDLQTFSMAGNWLKAEKATKSCAASSLKSECVLARYFNSLNAESRVLTPEETRLSHSRFRVKVSTNGGVVPHSHGATLNLLSVGAKLWVLVSPEAYDNTLTRYQFEKYSKRANNGNNYLHRTPNFTASSWFQRHVVKNSTYLSVPHVVAIQEPGDAILVPENWGHVTLDLCKVQIGAVFQGCQVNHGYTSFEEACSGVNEFQRCNLTLQESHLHQQCDGLSMVEEDEDEALDDHI